MDAVAGRLAEAATHVQAARALFGLAQECVSRRDELRARQALKARCSAALVGSAALETLLRSPSAPAAASAAAAAGSLVPLAQLGFAVSERVLEALAALLRSGDSAAAAAAVAAFTQLASARKHCTVGPAVAHLAAAALCGRLAAGGARAPWLACTFAVAHHAAGLDALRRDAGAPAAFASALVEDSLAPSALTLCASCADGDDAFAASLVACDEGGCRRALRVALCGRSSFDASSALRLLAALASALPLAADGAGSSWTALAPDVATALRGADCSLHEAEVMASAIAALLQRTQPRCYYGARRAQSPWHAPLVDVGVPPALLALASAHKPYALECWRAIACIAARGRVGSPALVAETAAAACDAVLDRTWLEVPCGGYRFSSVHRIPSLETGCGNLLLWQMKGTAYKALFALVRTESETASAPNMLQALLNQRLRFTSAGLVAFSGSKFEDGASSFCFNRAVESLAVLAVRAGLRGTPSSVSALAKDVKLHPWSMEKIPPWGAWAPIAGDACWSADATTEAGEKIRLVACLLPSVSKGDPCRTPLMELLEGLASPVGGLCGEHRCWAALALRRGCGRCGARTVLGEDFGAALMHGARFADVELLCGEGGALQPHASPAHSIFLAARCPRLLPKRADGNAATLRGHVPQAALSAVLSWIYTSSCDAAALADDALAAAVRLAKGASLHTLAALLTDALPHLDDDMPCLSGEMRRSLDALAGTDAELLPGFGAPPVPVHRVVCAARCDYFRAALSPAFAAGEDGAAAALRCSELCGAGAMALREWLYTGSVRAFEADGAPLTRSAVAVAARVAAAAEVRLLPALATAARAYALAAVPALQPAEAADAASEAAAAGEWDIASAAAHAAAAAFPALRDDGTLERLPPQLAEAIRQAHVLRASEAA